MALAIVIAARRLRPYFQSHPVVVKTDYPIKKILQKPELSRRMVAWSVKLLESDIKFEARGPIKSQVLADFIAELIPGPEKEVWIIYVGGSSNIQGSGVGIILENPTGIFVEHALRFKFKVEYEGLLVGLQLSLELGAQNLHVRTDSQIVANQVGGNYQARNEVLTRYST